jgi:hypothetical protein
MISQVIVSVVLMLAAWLLVCLIGHGYANTVDHVAYLLHRHAEKVRQMHDRRKAIVAERWVRCLENCVVDVLTEIKYDKREGR